MALETGQADDVKKPQVRKTWLSPIVRIERTVVRLRGHNVILDRDLALLYEVDPKVLNQAVKRNAERFSEGFMFQLTKKERDEVITICDNLSDLNARTFVSNSYE